MALIIDPDLLRQSTVAATGAADGEVFINTTAKTIELISTTDGAPNFAGSNLIAADGVTLQALYSFLKAQWKEDAALIVHEFPMEAITSEQFEFINGWTLTDATTASRTYVRTGGWAEKNAAGAVTAEYMSVVTLGSFVEEATQTAYYAFSSQSSSTAFTYPGPVNQAVKIYEDTDGNGTPDFDRRTEVLSVYIRPPTTGTSGNAVGYTYDLSTTTDIGATTVTYQAYRFPLSSVVDLNITLIDSEVTALITSAGLQITYDANDTSAILPIELQGGPYNFSHTINSTNGDGELLTPSEVYNFVQYQLRQTGDIDDGAGTVIGNLAEPLLTFVGSVLETFSINGGTEGVLIDNINTSDTANFKFRDDSDNLQAFPTVAAGSITFNQNLIDDPATKYWMFYQNANSGANVFPGSTALLVPDFNGVDITGDLHSVTTTAASGASTNTNGAATAAGTTLTSAAAGWTVSDFDDKVLVISGGNVNDGYYNIVTNDATTITVDRQFEATESGMTFVIKNRSNGTVAWDFNYDDGPTRGDGNPSIDAPISVVSLGLDDAQYVSANFTITGASGQAFSIVAALERNYSDPL